MKKSLNCVVRDGIAFPQDEELCNTSYAVKKGMRGLHIGEQLVNHHCLVTVAE